MKNNVTDVEAVELQTDTRSPARLGFWVLVVGFGLFLAWAAWAPLDEGVVAPATVSVEMRRKTIQHLQGGVRHGCLPPAQCSCRPADCAGAG